MFTNIIKFLHLIKTVNSKVTVNCLKMEIFSINFISLDSKLWQEVTSICVAFFFFFLLLCQYGGHIARAACLHFYEYEVSFYFLLR